MRILQISSARTFSGTERHVVELSRGLAARDIDVFAALRPTNEWEQRLDLPADHIAHVSVRNSFGMLSANRIARFARQHNVDVIHAHGARDYLAASAAARIAGTRLVLTRHVMPPMKAFHRFALSNVDAAIAVSEPVRQNLSRVFRPEVIHLIHNGIDITGSALGGREMIGREFREFHSIPPKAPLIVSIGELKVAKGQRDLVLAANELLKVRPDVHFVIAGVDNTLDQKFRRELKRLVRVLGMDDKFLWLGWLDNIGPLLAAADIFVSPSHTESFGIAILEAMSAGCPVVATSTDGASELIDDARALVPVKEPLRLAEAVGWYIGNADARSELGARLREVATAKFGVEAMVEATEAIYRKLL